MRAGNSLYISVVVCNHQKVSINKLRMLFYSDHTHVILVDYRQAVRVPNYAHAMTNAELFGHMTNMLAHYKSFDPAKHVDLIVYSLGSHTAHYTAKFNI